MNNIYFIISFILFVLSILLFIFAQNKLQTITIKEKEVNNKLKTATDFYNQSKNQIQEASLKIQQANYESIEAEKKSKEAEKRYEEANNFILRNVKEQAEIDSKLEKAKEELDFNLKEINKIQKQIQENQENFEKTSAAAADNYFKVLEQSYVNKEKDYKDRINKINIEIEQYEKELAQIRNSRAAAMEALRKEKQVKEDKDSYRLNLSETALKDIRLLKSIQSDISNSIVIDKIIWSNYYQPLAKVKFPKIIGKATACGIYKITCLVTDECYIGQSKDCCDRWKQHCKNALGVGTITTQNKLYQTIKEYGLNNFTFEMVEECKLEYLNEREKYYIDLYDSYNFGLNGNQGNG